MKDRHDANVSEDYSTEIVNELVDGKLVIVDQSTGSPTEIQYSSDRVMWELFNRQKEVFTNPKRDENGAVLRDEQGGILPPPDVIVYVEEAHNLLPSQNANLNSDLATNREGRVEIPYRPCLLHSGTKFHSFQYSEKHG